MRNSLISGRQAVDAVTRLKAIERARAMDHGRGRNTGFDAAGASGLTFLNAQLEIIEPNLVKPLQATTHARDIIVKTGGGVPEYISAWASNYASTGGSFFGLQGTNNTEIPQAQVDIQKNLWPVYKWSSGFTVTYFDLMSLETAQRSGQPAPFSIQDLYDKSVEMIWAKALDYVTYLGFLGNPGLVNNANVPATVVASGGSGTAWSTKTPAQILVDVNFAINQTVQNSGYDMAAACANRLLVPYSQYQALTLPMTIGGIGGYQSTLDYIVKNCVAAAYGIDFKIFPLPDPWIATQGLGGTARGVCYRADEDCLLLRVPLPKQKAMTVPTVSAAGGGWQTMFAGAVSSVIFKRTTTMQYIDAI